MKSRTALKRKVLVITAFVMFLILMPLAASADNLRIREFGSSGPDDALEAGGFVTFTYWLQQVDSGDGFPGCNPDEDTPATVEIITPTGLTATPSTFEFTTCRAPSNTEVVFTSSTVGTYDVAHSISGGRGGEYLNFADFTLEVVDTTAPTITINTPEDGANYVANSVVNADYECADVSEIALCAGPVADGDPIDTGEVGAKSFTVNAEDEHGNSDSLTHDYNVFYDFDGFFNPVDPDAPNQVKAGQVIPIRFSLNGDFGLDAVESTTSSAVMCPGGPLIGDPDVQPTDSPRGNGLKYSSGSDQYQYLWKTDKDWSDTCREFSLELDDGTTHTAVFHFTR